MITKPTFGNHINRMHLNHKSKYVERSHVNRLCMLYDLHKFLVISFNAFRGQKPTRSWWMLITTYILCKFCGLTHRPRHTSYCMCVFVCVCIVWVFVWVRDLRWNKFNLCVSAHWVPNRSQSLSSRIKWFPEAFLTLFVSALTCCVISFHATRKWY